jgi:NitT/TauT family transport system ATP-binding protein
MSTCRCVCSGGRAPTSLNASTRRLRARRTVVFVTHSVFESVYLSQRVVVMTPRPGRVAEQFAVEAVEPRGEEFRTSPAYVVHCRSVSEALARASATKVA